MELHPSRRGVLTGGIAFCAWAAIPALARAAGGRDPRFVALVLRGGMDGLGVLAPLGDPLYAGVRGPLALPSEGPDAGVPLDGFFALHPRAPTLAALYRAGEALFVHAVHTGYRDRSHFDAQDVLENGTPAPRHIRDGWLGRAIAALPAAERIARQGAFAAASQVPLVLRGADTVVTWLPGDGDAPAPADARAAVLALYEHSDPTLAAAMGAALRFEATLAGGEATALARDAAGVVRAAGAAGRAMAADDGPRIGVLDMAGFDTHRGQSAAGGALGATLARLDTAVAALKDGLGAAWGDTVVAIMTEFGRTVRANASSGTDHGAATVAMLVGGAVKGGRVIADWPGLAEPQLWQGRDLMPTADLRAVLKGALAGHLGLDAAALARVFPETADLAALGGLVRAA